jgi:hypothetical protein
VVSGEAQSQRLRQNRQRPEPYLRRSSNRNVLAIYLSHVIHAARLLPHHCRSIDLLQAKWTAQYPIPTLR